MYIHIYILIYIYTYIYDYIYIFLCIYLDEFDHLVVSDFRHWKGVFFLRESSPNDQLAIFRLVNYCGSARYMENHSKKYQEIPKKGLY